MSRYWLQEYIMASALSLVMGLNLPECQQQMKIQSRFWPAALDVCDTHLPSSLGACLGTDDDLEFYVRKCGDILGVTSELPKDKQDAKYILEYIFFQVVAFKKLNQVFLITIASE